MLRERLFLQCVQKFYAKKPQSEKYRYETRLSISTKKRKISKHKTFPIIISEIISLKYFYALAVSTEYNYMA